MKKLVLLIFLFPTLVFTQTEKIISTVQKNSPNSRKNPSVYCLVDEKKKFTGYPYRINGKNVYLLEIQNLETNVAYILEGNWKKDLTTHIKEVGSCEPEEVIEQIRSDWLAEENRKKGMDFISWGVGETTRERLKELSYFEVSKVQKLDAFTCKNKKGNIEISIKSIPELKGIKLIMVSHYEGGRGKPQPKYLNKKISLKKNSTTVQVAKSLSDEDRGKKISFRLQTVSFQGAGKDFQFNYDISAASCR